MKTAWRIGILTATGMGLGTWVKLRFSRKDDCGCSNEKQEVHPDRIKKLIGQAKQAGVPPEEPSHDWLANLKSAIAPSLLDRKEQFLQNLARWGTREGIIEVSDLLHPKRLYDKLKTIREGRIESLGTPSNLKMLDSYLRDLERWGTKEGIIDVSNDEDVKKKKKKLLKSISRQGKSVTKRYLKAKKKEFQKQGKKVDTKEQLLNALQKDYEVTQINIRNISAKERIVSLWEANRSIAVSPPNPTDVEDHKVTGKLVVSNTIHPQGMVVNPANQFTYIANQLSNNVSVVSTEGQLIRLVQLEPSNFPGFNSPVAIAVNTKLGSDNYGKVYVIGSVSNTLSIIDLNFKVSQTLAVGVRPLSIAFNPVNEKLYVSNYVGNSVSVIDSNTLQQEVIKTGTHPLGVGVNTRSGEVFIANSADNSISIFDKDNLAVTQIENVGQKPSNIAYHPGTQEMFVVSTNSNEVIPINAGNYQKGLPVAVGNNPYEIVYNKNNDFIYVASRDDDKVTVIAPNKTVRAILDLGAINNGFAINQTSNVLFTSSTSTGFINVIGYKEQSSSVIVDEGFEEKRRDFQHNPVVVKHVRFILSGNERFNVMRLTESNSTGNSTIRTISFSDYRSPQNIQNVSEVNGLEGAVIDGSNGWGFKIAPNQTITMMVYYRQFDMYNLLPETSRKSMGVEMSKGVSRNLSDPHSNYNPIT
ncbi:YncE family protein [Fulvivirgaceae bacterium BMA10]|uniref:YncE family protein n=1 Tax=Splendidivirga corallicola TaxID=3051826 RepID=A0ABT8KKJ2_9BACT|nr:YncE family protein [Fulvivirgaceae bacterium BMA10]